MLKINTMDYIVSESNMFGGDTELTKLALL
jgi:hypothetical protein